MRAEEIGRVFSEAGFYLPQEDLERFQTYLEELKRWNRVHNLTSLRRDEDIVRRHFLDSLSLAKCFEDLGVQWRGKDLVDVGSGAGFPGVPLKIYLRDLNLYLVESVGKKCSFLEFLKVRLSLTWTVLCKRAEDLEGRFHIAVCRALGRFEDIAPLLENLTTEWVFVMKGKESEAPSGYGAYEVRLRGLPRSYILWKRLSGPLQNQRLPLQG